MTITLGLIGGGVMAEAILSGLLARRLGPLGDVLVSEPLASRREYLAQTYGVAIAADTSQLIQSAPTILLAVKPQVLPGLASELAAGLAGRSARGHAAPPLILSILAGTPIAKLEAVCPGCAVVRAMPNTPATVGAGITAIAPSAQVAPEQLARAREIFGAIGQVVEVNEGLMDAVTGLSGSGPAFVALFIEALSDGGVAAGLPRMIAQELALQTVAGTTKLLIDSQLHPAELKDRVTSPGGTTIAGVASLERAAFRSSVIEAVRAAAARSRELGQS